MFLMKDHEGATWVKSQYRFCWAGDGTQANWTSPRKEAAVMCKLLVWSFALKPDSNFCLFLL